MAALRKRNADEISLPGWLKNPPTTKKVPAIVFSPWGNNVGLQQPINSYGRNRDMRCQTYARLNLLGKPYDRNELHGMYSQIKSATETCSGTTKAENIIDDLVGLPRGVQTFREGKDAASYESFFKQCVSNLNYDDIGSIADQPIYQKDLDKNMVRNAVYILNRYVSLYGSYIVDFQVGPNDHEVLIKDHVIYDSMLYPRAIDWSQLENYIWLFVKGWIKGCDRFIVTMIRHYASNVQRPVQQPVQQSVLLPLPPVPSVPSVPYVSSLSAVVSLPSSKKPKYIKL